MLVVPWLLGALHAVGEDGLEAVHVVLLGFWMVGYFAFFAATQWLRSRRKPRYVPAVVTYCAAATPLGLAVLALRPQWWSWLLVYVPLCAVAMWLSSQRRERDVVSGLATLLAACGIPLVMGSDGLLRPGGLPELLAVATICFGYFFGTVFYVKTLIRERGRASWVVVSVAWHLACVVAALWLPEPLPSALVVVFFTVAALRALLVPGLWPMRGRRVRVSLVGVGEFVLSLGLVALLAPSLIV